PMRMNASAWILTIAVAVSERALESWRDRKSHRHGLGWAFVGVLMFSFSVPLTKEAVGGFDPFLTATGRAVIAGVIAAALLAVTRAQLPPPHLRRPIVFTML